jgi:hypothetical protein
LRKKSVQIGCEVASILVGRPEAGELEHQHAHLSRISRTV